MNLKHRFTVFEFAATAAFALTANTAIAARTVPVNDTDVLYRIPAAVALAAQKLQTDVARLAATPDSSELAVSIARTHIQTARSEGDPRFLSYAQAALSPWWTKANPPSGVRLLRATIAQSQHRFDSALADFDAVLNEQPDNAQARLTRATVRMVTGNSKGAQADCLALPRTLPAIYTLGCQAQTATTRVQVETTYAQLMQMRAQLPLTADAASRNWLYSLAAELALRSGNTEAARAHHLAALTAAPEDVFTLAGYADFLLDSQRPQEVLRLLAGRERADALLLRLAIAARRIDSPVLAVYQQDLAARFAAAALRGDSSHAREQARFALEVTGNAAEAWSLAQSNLRTQRELPDWQIALAAARAMDKKWGTTGTGTALQKLQSEYRATALYDVRLDA